MATESAQDLSWGSSGNNFGWSEYGLQSKSREELERFYASGFTGSLSNLPKHLKPWYFGPRAPENTRKQDDANCPTAIQHLGSFSPDFVASLSDQYMENPTTMAYFIDSHRTWNFGQFSLRNPDLGFGRGTNMYRDFRLLFVQHLYLGTNTRTHHAVIHFDNQCMFCVEAKRKGNWAPCFDPFIEARNGNLGVRFDGVVAFFNRHTKIVVLREDWCWQTLKMEREVIAVYSRHKNRNKHNWLKRGWIYWKTGWPIREEREVNGITYIEDLYNKGYTRRMKVHESAESNDAQLEAGKHDPDHDSDSNHSSSNSEDEEGASHPGWWAEAEEDDLDDEDDEDEMRGKVYDEKYDSDEKAMQEESEGSFEHYRTGSPFNEKDFQWGDQSYHH